MGHGVPCPYGITQYSHSSFGQPWYYRSPQTGGAAPEYRDPSLFLTQPPRVNFSPANRLILSFVGTERDQIATIC